jgi:hypothetical protein
MAKYPKITVEPPKNSNIFVVANTVVRALREAKVKPEDIDEFRVDVMSCAPSCVTQTVKKWVVYTPKSV